MKIMETIERECCLERDLVSIAAKGMFDPEDKVTETCSACKHCGQLWVLVRRMDGAGSMDSEWTKLAITGYRA